MKALYYPEWDTLEIKDLPKPALVEGEVLIRVANCGICGSELESFRGHSPRRTPPRIMGHEFCGYVEETYGARSDWKVGDRVISHSQVHCGQCTICLRGDANLCPDRQVFGMHRPGAFAEYVAVPERILVSWPEGLSGATAVFAEPLANGINAMRQGHTDRKSRVVVLGAGPIGLMCAFAAKHLYNSSVVVSDMIPERLEAAQTIGADLTVDGKEQDLRRETEKFWSGNQAEFVIDAVGSGKTKTLSLELLEPAGTAVWVGLHENRIELDSYLLTLPQKSVSGSYSGSMTDFQQAVSLLASGALDTSWAKEYPIEEGEVAFRNVLAGRGSDIKAILKFGESRA